jgi:phospholipase B1
MTSLHHVMLLCLALLSALAVGQFDLSNCPPLPPRNISTSITTLHPSDISVVMALGDSITAGFGIVNSWNESRGVSFSMGGDANAITLSNFLKVFNPSVVGYSTNTAPTAVCYGPSCPTPQYYSADANNAALSGALIVDLVSVQANYLIRQVNLRPDMDVTNDWKVLTIFIGANDLCASCTFNVSYLTPDDYENNLMGTLERIRTSLPRTFVNLVQGFNISQAYDLSLSTQRCNNISRSLFIQCECLFDPDAGEVRETIDSLITEFNRRAVKIATYYQNKAYSNFAVVVQPFASGTYISDLPSRFLSDLDCFHPSHAGHEAMAIALWNAMVTPAANKQTYLNMSDAPICPTANTLLYTY